MARALDLVAFLQDTSPLIDVRSPNEFARGHLPEAVNLPLFNDDEHAEIGTLYKQQSPEIALLRGLDIIGPKMSTLVREAKLLAPKGQIRVHCWRGGNRSGSMAWLLEFAGLKVSTLRGGYKAFRSEMRACFSRPWHLIVLGGMTGSAKTEILKELKNLGEQVVDLEALAHHRGSAFGRLGLPPQPTVEQFENTLGQAFSALDPSRPVWIEDESKKIGCVVLPYDLCQHMHRSPLIVLDVSREERVQHLLKTYAPYSSEELSACVKKLRKRLGSLRVQQCLEALAEDNLALVAQQTLDYYDKSYRYGLSKRPQHLQYPFALTINDLKQAAKTLQHFAREQALYPESTSTSLALGAVPHTSSTPQGESHV